MEPDVLPIQLWVPTAAIKRQCGNQPAHQSLITDVLRCPLLCTIHHLINFTLARVENVPVVPAVLDKGHQRSRGVAYGRAEFVRSNSYSAGTMSDRIDDPAMMRRDKAAP
jgi:hypothetical protein